MIEMLKGIKETVNFKGNTGLRLYDNDMNEGYPNHWHTPMEIIMPVVNSYTAVCSNVTYNLRVGDILFITPGAIHNFPAAPFGERLIFQVDVSILHLIKELKSTISLISPSVIITKENSPSIHGRIQDMMFAIKEEYFGNAPLSEAAIYSILIEMFVLIGREYTAKTNMFHVRDKKQKEYTEKFLSLCDYINDNCTKDLTLDSIADLAGFSKYHFTRLFKQFTGVSFYKYVNQKKVAIAENLLIDSDITVTEVALRSGFASLSSFIRMFKIIKSCTPTEFRNMFHL